MAEEPKPPVVILVVGMAGSGKTTVIQRLFHELHTNKPGKGYFINLDPAVSSVPYHANVDIRDTVNYKEVMAQYNLGPNGGIVTSLNLFATRFHQLLDLLVKPRDPPLEYIVIDTPGQIEVFTWSASGSIITQTLGISLPTVMLYVVDTPRTVSPTTFMSNMLYACSIVYKTKLPFILVLNKNDIVAHDFAITWMRDSDAFNLALRNEKSYISNLTHSMALLLDEFYETLTAVGFSAATGAGVPELFNAIAEGARQYHTIYKPELEAQIAARKQKEELRQAKQMEKLKKDLEVSASAMPTKEEQETREMEEEKEEEEEEEEEEDEEEKKEFEELIQQFGKQPQL